MDNFKKSKKKDINDFAKQLKEENEMIKVTLENQEKTEKEELEMDSHFKKSKPDKKDIDNCFLKQLREENEMDDMSAKLRELREGHREFTEEANSKNVINITNEDMKEIERDFEPNEKPAVIMETDIPLLIYMYLTRGIIYGNVNDPMRGFKGNEIYDSLFNSILPKYFSESIKKLLNSFNLLYDNKILPPNDYNTVNISIPINNKIYIENGEIGLDFKITIPDPIPEQIYAHLMHNSPILLPPAEYIVIKEDILNIMRTKLADLPISIDYVSAFKKPVSECSDFSIENFGVYTGMVPFDGAIGVPYIFSGTFKYKINDMAKNVKKYYIAERLRTIYNNNKNNNAKMGFSALYACFRNVAIESSIISFERLIQHGLIAKLADVIISKNNMYIQSQQQSQYPQQTYWPGFQKFTTDLNYQNINMVQPKPYNYNTTENMREQKRLY